MTCPNHSSGRPTDICRDCRLERREHHHDGAAYGVCGQFSEIAHAPVQPAPDSHTVLWAAYHAFESIRLNLVNHLNETERTAFWKAVEGRRSVGNFLASQPSPAATVEELRAFYRPLLGDVGSTNDRAFERLIAKLFPQAAPVTDGSIQEGDVLSYTMTDGVGKVTAHVRPHNGSSAGSVAQVLREARRFIANDPTRMPPSAMLARISEALATLDQPHTPSKVVPAPEPARWPAKGDRMKFLGVNGYPFELDAAKKIFTVGNDYEVHDCDVGNWSHSVQFIGVKGRFNGVMFELLSSPLTRPVRRCQKCGAATNGEEAWVNGQTWCHPCADACTHPSHDGARDD